MAWTLRSWQSRGGQDDHTLSYVTFVWPEGMVLKRIVSGQGAFAHPLPVSDRELAGVDLGKTLVVKLGGYTAATQGDRI